MRGNIGCWVGTFEALMFLTEYLKPNGIIYLSVPNIANIYIRSSLLFGRFNYTDKGILDRTHLRFFTLYTLKKFVRGCGFNIKTTKVTPIPFPLVFKSMQRGKLLYPVHVINNQLTQLFRTLLGFQFILVLGKRK